MPKPILFIVAKEAANDIRSGASDIALMQKYGISAKALEKLFKKLIDKGDLGQSELEDRMRLAERSHVVDLVSSGVPELKKTRVNPNEAVAAIRSGMSDIELMEKYNISARGLESLFSKLIEAGEIDRAELESRRHAEGWAEIAFASGTDQSEAFSEDGSAENLEKRAWFRRLSERNKVLIAGLAGAVVGALAVTAVSFVFKVISQSEDTFVFHPTRKTSVYLPGKGAQDQLNNVIPMLKDIREYEGVGTADAHFSRTAYEDCLKRCESEFDPIDQMEREIFFNCKRSCLYEHSEQIRKIRQRYHAPPSVRAP
jgi:hypothetical protein